MNNLIHLASAILDPNDNHVKEELPDNALVSHASGDFSLSNYEDDDDESGFCCPCCLPR